MSTTTQWGWGDDQEPDGHVHLHLVDPLNNYQRHVKPVMDRVMSAILLVLAVPLVATAMLLVLLTLGRPVIYRQSRVGLGGRRFELYKLRTMIPERRNGDPNSYHGPERRRVHKSRRDPRVPRPVAWLRSVRLDELPQLWNVMRGDMSMVGPRPELPEIVETYEDWQHHRHSVKPGLTGLWQVSAPDDKLMHECTELDLEYISNVSLKTDLELLLNTPAAMIRRRGF